MTLVEQEGLWDELLAAVRDTFGVPFGRDVWRAVQPLPVHRHSNHTIPPPTCRNPCKLPGIQKGQTRPQQPDKQAPNIPRVLTLLQPLPFPSPSVFADEETFHGCCPNLPSLLQNVPTKGRISTRQGHSVWVWDRMRGGFL